MYLFSEGIGKQTREPALPAGPAGPGMPSHERITGGFDLTQIITTMIGNHKKSAKGDLSCEGNGPAANHSAIVYEVAIQYA